VIGQADIARLRDAVLAGGVALVPTDTVYGLAAALDSPEGIDALYRLKGRPREQPCQVILYAPGLLDEALAPLDDRTIAAARALLPGPTTCLVPDPRGRFAAAAGNTPGSVGLRVPVMDAVFHDFGIPMVATSANDPGGVDPATLDEVTDRIRASVAFAADAGRLPGTASAVVDLRRVAGGGPAVLIRSGPRPAGVAAALTGVGVSLDSPQ
jgi:L-threonylcarbamoyladenylate synthase